MSAENTPNETEFTRAHVMQRAEDMDDDGLMWFVASDNTVDSYNDIIDQDGWETKDFKKNPVFMPFHSYREAPIGTIPEFEIGEKFLIGVDWDSEDEYSSRLEGKYNRGVMRGVSVGFRPLEYSYDKERRGYNYIRQKLLEVSAVPIPSNPNALKLKSAASPEARERLDSELREWLQVKACVDPGFVSELLEAAEIPAVKRLEDVARQLEMAIEHLATEPGTQKQAELEPEKEPEPHHEKAEVPVLRLRAQ